MLARQVVPRLCSPHPELFHMGYRSDCIGSAHADWFPLLEKGWIKYVLGLLAVFVPWWRLGMLKVKG